MNKAETEKTRKMIFKLLDEHGATGVDLATAIGTTKNVVSHWKCNSSVSFRKYLPEIAKYFGVTVDYLVGSSSEKLKSEDNEFLSSIAEAQVRPELMELIKIATGASKEAIESGTAVIELLKKKQGQTKKEVK